MSNLFLFIIDNIINSIFNFCLLLFINCVLVSSPFILAPLVYSNGWMKPCNALRLFPDCAANVLKAQSITNSHSDLVVCKNDSNNNHKSIA